MGATFDMRRAGLLAKWMLANDKQYNKKNLYNLFTVFFLLFQLPNIMCLIGLKEPGQGTQTIEIAVFATTIVFIVMGGGYMLYPYDKWKDGQRQLDLLPASAAEKFVMRYLVSIITMGLIIVACIIVSDVLQYIVGIMIGVTPLQSITKQVLGLARDIIGSGSGNGMTKAALLTMIAVWSHTVYLAGANLFRNIKYSLFLTSMLMSALGFIFIQMMVWLEPSHVRSLILSLAWPSVAVLVLLSIINVGLAYRLFGHHQIAGKYINKI